MGVQVTTITMEALNVGGVMDQAKSDTNHNHNAKIIEGRCTKWQTKMVTFGLKT